MAVKNLMLKRAIFFAGWLLSPLTFWNDAIVNIPIAYVLASLARRVFRADFLILVLVFYWISNLLGLVLMYFSGRKILMEGHSLRRELAVFAGTIIAYTAVILFVDKAGLLKPF